MSFLASIKMTSNQKYFSEKIIFSDEAYFEIGGCLKKEIEVWKVVRLIYFEKSFCWLATKIMWCDTVGLFSFGLRKESVLQQSQLKDTIIRVINYLNLI